MTSTLRLSIDANALADNIAIVRAKLSGLTRLCAAIKANAYGLGVDSVAPVMMDHGVELYFVASIAEAVHLRRVIGLRPRIAVFTGYTHDDSVWRDLRLIPVINSLEQAQNWLNADGGASILHIDTGINRLGVRCDALDALPRGYKPDIVLSHFASSDDPESPQTELQFNRFMDATNTHFAGVPRSLSNSAGIWADTRYHLEYVRPGRSLYGQPIVDDQPNPMRRVVTLEALTLATSTVKEGESLGYNATFIAPRDMVTATIGAGYADGLSRSLSNKGVLYFDGQPCPIVGRVSMDLSILDVTDLARRPAAGDWVEIIGPHQSELDLARAMGTITYEVMTGFGTGARCERIITKPQSAGRNAAASR